MTTSVNTQFKSLEDGFTTYSTFVSHCRAVLEDLQLGYFETLTLKSNDLTVTLWLGSEWLCPVCVCRWAVSSSGPCAMLTSTASILMQQRQHLCLMTPYRCFEGDPLAHSVVSSITFLCSTDFCSFDDASTLTRSSHRLVWRGSRVAAHPLEHPGSDMGVSKSPLETLVSEHWKSRLLTLEVPPTHLASTMTMTTTPIPAPAATTMMMMVTTTAPTMTSTTTSIDKNDNCNDALDNETQWQATCICTSTWCIATSTITTSTTTIVTVDVLTTAHDRTTYTCICMTTMAKCTVSQCCCAASTMTRMQTAMAVILIRQGQGYHYV